MNTIMEQLTQKGAFFDVRDRLHDHTFILNGIVRFKDTDGDSDKIAHASLKLFAYLGGVPAVDLLTVDTRPMVERQSVQNVLLALGKRARALLQLDTIYGNLASGGHQAAQALAMIKAMEQHPATFGDENAPRTEEKAIEEELFSIVLDSQASRRG